MNISNVVIMELADYNKLLRERDDLEKQLRGTFILDTSWKEPRVQLNVRLYKKYLKEMLVEAGLDEKYQVGELPAWKKTLDIFELTEEEIQRLEAEKEAEEDPNVEVLE